MHGPPNILELITMFLHSIYQQPAGKSNLFHMTGGRFHSGNTWGTFKVLILNSIRLASMAMVFWYWPYFSIVETVQIQLHLKGTWNIPESYIPSLGTSCENMALKYACIDSVWGSTCPKTFSGAIVTLVTGTGSGLSKQTNWALMKLGWLVEWGFYALSAIFRARTYNCNLFSPVMMITWWMKLGGNRPPGDNPLLFSTSGTGSFICPVA